MKVYDQTIPSKIRLAYSRAKAQAKFRGDVWALTITDFWDIWEHSGAWEHRGRKPHQYCMVRKEDLAPWCKENCIIVTRRMHLKKQCYESMLKITPPSNYSDKHAVVIDSNGVNDG